MNFINEKIKVIKPSATLAVKTKVNQLKAQGHKVVNFGPGEPDIDTPEHIKLACENALKAGKTKYTDVAGIAELREAVAQKLTNDNGVACKAANVIINAGGKQALHSLFDVTLNPNDEVVIFSPYWVSYPELVALCGGKPVIVNGDVKNQYKVTPTQLQAALTQRTKFVIFNSPSNPAGVGYTESEQKALGAVIAKSNSLVVSDEIYEKIVYDDFKFCSFAKACPELAGRTVTVNSLSKTYSMTGWRVGYATGPQEIISAMITHQGQTVTNVTSFAQYGALAAITGPQDFLKPMIASFDRRIGIAQKFIASCPGLSLACKPQGAFYLFIRIDDLIGCKHVGGVIKGSNDFANFLLDQAKVAVVAGEAFGDDRAFRISAAVSDAEVEEGMSKIVAAVKMLDR